MSVALTINGVVYNYPSENDDNWATAATGWAQAVTAGMLQKSGGSFTLTNELDFGASFGIKSLYYKSRTANIAAAGQVRLARADTISWRNQANSADLALTVDASNQLTFNGTALASGSFLPLAGGTVTGQLVVSRSGNTTGNPTVLLNPTTGTNATLYGLNNTGGGGFFGLETSVGGTITTGTTAYATLIGCNGATPLQFVTNNIVRGTVASTGSLTWSGGVVLGVAGSISAPTYSFTGDPDTGIYNVSANAVGFVTNGILRGSFTSSGSLQLNATTSGTLDLIPAATTTSYTITMPSAAPTVNGQVLSATTAGVASWTTINATTAPSVQRFTSGSGTYTTPAGVLYIKVRMAGGGGGGRGTGGDGGNGGNTTFGTSLLTANGGVGGSSSGTGALGGTVTINSPAVDVNSRQGGQGGAGLAAVTATQTYGGAGGNNAFGGAAGPTNGAQTGYTPIANTGAGGGGGGGGTAYVSGAGGGAGGYIEAIITSPSATYAYAVGAGGTAGAVGTGSAGGAGAAGIIIVEEFRQ